MSHEEFGLSDWDHLQIRARLATQALREQHLLEPATPSVGQADSEEDGSLTDRILSGIMEEFEVGPTEARVILAEQLAFSNIEGENNGEDF